MDTEIIFLPLHILSLLLVLYSVVHADHMGFTWITGKVKTLSKEQVEKYHKYTWIGLIGLMLSGLGLFYPMREFLLTRPQFYLKMLCVLALFVNSFAIGSLKNIAIATPFEHVPTSKKIFLFISGAISTTCWIGAFILAFFLIPD